MRTMIGIIFLVTCLIWTQVAGYAASNDSYIVAVKQLNPNGVSSATTCEENAKTCSLEVKLARSETDFLKVEVLITSGEAYFKFMDNGEYFEGNHLRHFYISVGKRRSDKKVTLYRSHPHERLGKSDSLRQLPVLKSSQRPVVELEITIHPKTADY